MNEKYSMYMDWRNRARCYYVYTWFIYKDNSTNNTVITTHIGPNNITE